MKNGRETRAKWKEKRRESDKDKSIYEYLIIIASPSSFSFQEGNNQTSSIKDKQTKDSGIIQDPNIIGRELFVSEIKEFYPATHIK